MTDAQFRGALKRLKLSRGKLAKLLGINVRTVYRWASGESDVPEGIALLLDCWEHSGGPPALQATRPTR